MEINVIRIRNILDNREAEIKKLGDQIINNINDELFEDDIVLVEHAKDPLFNIVFIETGGSETKFLELLPSIDKNFILLSSQHNNSLAACLEIKTYCVDKGINTFILLGDEPSTYGFIRENAKNMMAIKSLKNTNLGVIGKPSDWLICSQGDYGIINEKFGINLIKIGIDELILEINKHKYGKIPHLSVLEKKCPDCRTLKGALEIYGALERLVNKYHLSGFTIRCFDLLKEYKNTACLALGLFNERGIVATCEGDIPTMLTMYVARKIANLPSFQANPSYINLEKNEIILSHCTVPLNMCTKYELDTHFESGLGVAIHGQLRPGPITLIKYWPDLERMTCFEAELVENLSLKDYCRTQIKIRMDEDDLLRLLNNQFGNHLVVVYGKCADLITDFFFATNTFKLKRH